LENRLEERRGSSSPYRRDKPDGSQEAIIMEIQALKLVVSEQELNRMAAHAPLSGAPVRDLSVRLTPEGVHVKGKYQAWISMNFETLWKVDVQQGKIVAHLADVKVVGLPAAKIKGMLTESICGALDADGAVEADGDTMRIDLDQMLALRGFPARTNLTGIRCEMGQIIIESAVSG